MALDMMDTPSDRACRRCMGVAPLTEPHTCRQFGGPDGSLPWPFPPFAPTPVMFQHLRGFRLPACQERRQDSWWRRRQPDHCTHDTGETGWYACGPFMEYRTPIVRCCACGFDCPKYGPTIFSTRRTVPLRVKPTEMMKTSTACLDLLALIDQHLTRAGRGVTYPEQLPAAVERLIADHAEQVHASTRWVAGKRDRYFAIARVRDDNPEPELFMITGGMSLWGRRSTEPEAPILRFSRAADARALIQLRRTEGNQGPEECVAEVTSDRVRVLDSWPGRHGHAV